MTEFIANRLRGFSDQDSPLTPQWRSQTRERVQLRSQSGFLSEWEETGVSSPTFSNGETHYLERLFLGTRLVRCFDEKVEGETRLTDVGHDPHLRRLRPRLDVLTNAVDVPVERGKIVCPFDASGHPEFKGCSIQHVGFPPPPAALRKALLGDTTPRGIFATNSGRDRGGTQWLFRAACGY